MILLPHFLVPITLQAEASWSHYVPEGEEVTMGLWKTVRFFDLQPSRILDELIKNTGF